MVRLMSPSRIRQPARTSDAVVEVWPDIFQRVVGPVGELIWADPPSAGGTLEELRPEQQRHAAPRPRPAARAPQALAHLIHCCYIVIKK